MKQLIFYYFFSSRCCEGYKSRFVLLQYAVDMAIIVEQSNLTQPIPLKLQVHVHVYLSRFYIHVNLSENHFAISYLMLVNFFVFFVAISLSKVHTKLLHTDSRGIASSFNDASIHVLSCYGYQGQLLKAYTFRLYFIQ